jgi:hypothetical protein
MSKNWRIERAMTETVLHEHFGDHHDDQTARRRCAVPRRFVDCITSMEREANKRPLLSPPTADHCSILHAVSDVEQDHHNGAERRDRNFGLIAPSKQHQMAEARRRTEKVETKSNAR